jgi:hypothetical protein
MRPPQRTNDLRNTRLDCKSIEEANRVKNDPQLHEVIREFTHTTRWATCRSLSS